MINLLNAFYSNWKTWQTIIFFVLLGLVAIMLIYNIILFSIRNKHLTKGEQEKNVKLPSDKPNSANKA